MPIGLYTSCEVSAPCGLCSPQGIIGLLDVPGTFLNPDRMNAGLMWFTRGFVEYQFPNNARLVGKSVAALEFSMENVLRSAGHVGGLALRHHGRGQRPRNRHVDQPRRFRRQARRLHAGLVEAEGQPVRQAEELAGHAGGVVRRRREDFADDAWAISIFPPITRSGSGSRSRPTPAIPAASTFSAAASATTIRTSCCA